MFAGPWGEAETVPQQLADNCVCLGSPWRLSFLRFFSLMRPDHGRDLAIDWFLHSFGDGLCVHDTCYPVPAFFDGHIQVWFHLVPCMRRTVHSHKLEQNREPAWYQATQRPASTYRGLAVSPLTHLLLATYRPAPQFCQLLCSLNRHPCLDSYLEVLYL